MEQLLYFERLGNVVVRAGVHQPHGLLDLPERRDEDHRCCPQIRKGATEQLLTIQIGQADIADQDLAASAGQMAQSLLARLPPNRSVTFQLKTLHQQLPHDRIVINDADHGFGVGAGFASRCHNELAHRATSCLVSPLGGNVTIMRDPWSPTAAWRRCVHRGREQGHGLRECRVHEADRAGPSSPTSVRAAATAGGSPGPASTTSSLSSVRYWIRAIATGRPESQPRYQAARPHRRSEAGSGQSDAFRSPRRPLSPGRCCARTM